MAISVVRGAADQYVEQFVAALLPYEAAHPTAEIELYRQDPASIRLRITDKRFKGQDIEERETPVWELLDQLPEDVLSHLSILVLETPAERKKSYSSHDFDNPLPSRL